MTASGGSGQGGRRSGGRDLSGAEREARDRVYDDRERASTYVELGDLKTIARDKGWDKAFDWIVQHEKAEAAGVEYARGERERTVAEIVEAQADLQTALGFYRLDHGHGDHTEERLSKALARLHTLLAANGHFMYDPATHPEVPSPAAPSDKEGK